MLKIAAQIVSLAALTAAPLFAAAEPFRISSGERQVALIELYTSEGCSSCPPADRWMSQLKLDPSLWRGFNPIAFHVDYWDYIGWRDKFATQEFGERQRRYIDQGAARFVYTPGLFRNGDEWRALRADTQNDETPAAVGALSLSVDGLRIDAHFAAKNVVEKGLLLNVAVLGMNLQTKVRAGENKGKTLYHDFVVVGFSSVELQYVDGDYVATTEFPNVSVAPDERAIVAWVSNTEQQAPLQSVGGLLPST